MFHNVAGNSSGRNNPMHQIELWVALTVGLTGHACISLLILLLNVPHCSLHYHSMVGSTMIAPCSRTHSKAERMVRQGDHHLEFLRHGTWQVIARWLWRLAQELSERGNAE